MISSGTSRARSTPVISAPSAPAIGTTSIVWNGSGALVLTCRAWCEAARRATAAGDLPCGPCPPRCAGSPVRRRSSSGHFWRARPDAFATPAVMSPRSIELAPDARRTTAHACSPSRSSGAATTATSATCGSAAIASSISAAEMFSPPRMITSFNRSVIVRKPSAIDARPCRPFGTNRRRRTRPRSSVGIGVADAEVRAARPDLAGVARRHVDAVGVDETDLDARHGPPVGAVPFVDGIVERRIR